MDIEVYCQNPDCGELWGTGELVNPKYNWEPVVPHPDFRAYYDNVKNCWFCPYCGFSVDAHIVDSQPQLWLSDMHTPIPEKPRNRKRRLGKRSRESYYYDRGPEDTLAWKLIKTLSNLWPPWP
jgi:hypothetical protein